MTTTITVSPDDLRQVAAAMEAAEPRPPVERPTGLVHPELDDAADTLLLRLDDLARDAAALIVAIGKGVRQAAGDYDAREDANTADARTIEGAL